MSLWNEEVCAHAGQGQVAAHSWILRAQRKVAHLSPEGDMVRRGNQNPAMAPGHSGGGTWAGARHFGRRRSAVRDGGREVVGFEEENVTGRSPSN